VVKWYITPPKRAVEGKMKTVLVPTDTISENIKLYADYTKIQNLEAIYDIIRVRHQTLQNDVVVALHDHPGIQAWAGHELQLINFGLALCENMDVTSQHDGLYHIKVFLEEHLVYAESGDMGFPKWWGKMNVHVSHQSELRRLHPMFYDKVFPLVSMDIPLIWS
jgi:hypothetical protein